MTDRGYLACDLGAESGRVMLGRYADGKVTIEEIHRFPNGALKIAGSLRWDVPRIFEELKIGLGKTSGRSCPVESLSVDSWVLDYVLSGAGQPMLSLPHHYRDGRTDGPYAAALKSPGPEVIFAETGIQFMPFNSLYQLMADQEQSPALLKIVDRFLTVADYFHFLFCGVAAIEESLASTTQLYDPVKRAWSRPLIELLGFPERIFPRLVPSGTRLGPLLPEIAAETRCGAIEVIAGCSHDTGAAVVAVTASGEEWAYLSSGTWSLLGVELPAPLIDERARAHNFTNEAGFGGTTRFLKNIVGLWIVQECRRTWEREGRASNYATLTEEAEAAAPFRSLIDANAAQFAKPDAMPEKIAEFCRETGQPAPESRGQFARCIFESLALLYARTLDELVEVTGRLITCLHIIGGGSQNRLLNQLTADASGRVVLAGPVEATAIGNVLVQAITLGHLESLAALRETVRRSFAIERYEPRDRAPWQVAAKRLS